MQIDEKTVGLAAAAISAALGLVWRWWKRSKATIRIGPGRIEVRWRVDP